TNGQGFAFKRMEKIKHEYNKLLRKERKKMQPSLIQLEEEYPEHLRHLYLAERERLDEEQEKRRKDVKGEHSHKTPFIRRKQKMSSYQKTRQEYERIIGERARKREEFLKGKAQREEALKKYKEKKIATYQLLKRKTKKGQPNLNLHMEILLQKIQTPCK
uniref:Coiled-coil domain containing 59 n=1 Tax=Sinocyclocheilus grahami TaxID=75366 RepID=A0A672NUJ1_SINGR